MNLGFVNPALLWGLLAAAIPLAIHLFFRRRPKPTPFPAIDFLLKARRETERRLRLKKLLLFTARTLVLAAVAIAIARPRAEQPGEVAGATAHGPRATAIVLDASASMRYQLGNRPLFERARADALGALAGLSSEEPATVVVCGAEPPQAEPPGFDRNAVRRVLERAEASAGFSDLTACVQAGLRALTAAKAQESLPKRLVVATDLAAHAWRLDVPAPAIETPQGPVRPEVSVLDAARGAPLPNRAVVGLEPEPDPAAGPRGFRFTAVVANYGGSNQEGPAEVPLSLVIGTGPEARTAIRAFADVPNNGTARKTLLHAFPQGGPVVVHAQLPGDALPDDDARALSLVVPREVRVLVVDGAPSPVKYRDEAWYVESALASPASPVRPKLVDAEAFPKEDLSQFDVIYLLNVRSIATKGPELERWVENGGGLFLALGDQVDAELYGKELGALLPMPLHVEKTAAARGGDRGEEPRPARFAEVDFSHPALAIFEGEAKEGLLGVRTSRYILAKPQARGAGASRAGSTGASQAGSPGAAQTGSTAAPTPSSATGPRVLMSFDDGAPALVEARRGRGRVLLFTSSADRDWTDWPIRTSFLPAMQRFAGFLAGALDERRDPPAVVGARRTLRLDDGVELAALLGPDGRERGRPELERAGLVETNPGVLEFTPRQPGLWQVKVAARGQGEARLDPRLAFAVSADPRESDTRRLEPSELTAWFGGTSVAKVEGESRGGAGKELPLWSILLVLGVAAFFLEGILLA